MRRIFHILIGALVVAAAVLVWHELRTVRWNDARTMPPPLEAAVRAFATGEDARGLMEVDRLIERYRAPAWEPRARVLAAARLARAGQAARIPRYLPAPLAPAEPLSAHANFLRARGLLALHRFDAAAEAARRAIDAPGFPQSSDALILEAQARETAGDWSEALRPLAASSDSDVVVAAVRIAASHGGREQARSRLVGAILDPAARPDDIQRLLGVLEEIEPSAGARYRASERPVLPRAADALVEANRADTAVALLRSARVAGAPSQATPEEALAEAQALIKLGRTAGLPPLLARARSGDAAARDGAGYLAARVAAGEGRTTSYRAGLESLARRGSPRWRRAALLDLARLADGFPSAAGFEAYRRYRLVAGAEADPLALFREAWIAFELGRRADADAGFARCLAEASPDGVRAATLYWSARRKEAAGRTAEAKSDYRKLVGEFPNHYYGILAARRTGQVAAPAPVDAAPVEDTQRLGPAGRWLAAARQLMSVGLWDDASPCYKAAMAGGGPASAAIALEAARAALSSNAVAEAIGFAQTAVGDRSRTPVASVPRPLWRLLYPVPSADPLIAAARANRLDPDLVAAVALQESAYNPLAVSGAGARGLMQLMPDVGAELARAAGLARFKADDLFDPEINLKLGCAHLRDYIDRVGSVARALAAYNGGPSRVARWTIPHDDDERFVERVPIPETRLYVKRVLTNQRMYALVWPDGLDH
jgi:soluble lytic murein transglycosylase-like protein